MNFLTDCLLFTKASFGAGAGVNFAHYVNVLLRGLVVSLLCDITMNKCITYVVI